MADEAGSWNDLHGRFAVSRIDHSSLYSDGRGVYTSGAEEFFSRMRRAKIGQLNQWFKWRWKVGMRLFW
jgi:ISXO2-like transposase domain